MASRKKKDEETAKVSGEILQHLLYIAEQEKLLMEIVEIAESEVGSFTKRRKELVSKNKWDWDAWDEYLTCLARTALTDLGITLLDIIDYGGRRSLQLFTSDRKQVEKILKKIETEKLDYAGYIKFREPLMDIYENVGEKLHNDAKSRRRDLVLIIISLIVGTLITLLIEHWTKFWSFLLSPI